MQEEATLFCLAVFVNFVVFYKSEDRRALRALSKEHFLV
jgi:hypothetical protein